MENIINLQTKLQTAQVANNRLNEVYLAESEFAENKTVQDMSLIKGDMTFSNVSYQYGYGKNVLTDDPILILDEATSSLDILTEKKIVDNLMALDKTLIFIAHRLTIAERTEHVVVLKQGTHQDLLDQGGFYAHLIKS